VASWGLWVVFPAVFLLRIRKEHLAGGWRKALLCIARRLVIGLLFSSLLFGFLSAWKKWGPQYYTKLRLQEDIVVLVYPWQSPDTVVPVREIKSVKVVKGETVLHNRSRLRIVAANGEFKSFGFDQLNEQELAVLDKLRERVASN